MKKILTIAGSDCSGGAGIQADLKTMTALCCYGMSVITALTAQNTTGVYGVCDISADFVAKQIDCVFTDIRPDAVKIGMVSSEEIICAIAKKMKQYRPGFLIVDPVMVSSSGGKLLADGAQAALKNELLPQADIMTPNIPEAEELSGLKIADKNAMLQAAELLAEQYGGAVLLKGGHLPDSCDDLLYQNGQSHWLPGRRANTKNTHGTGCTLSSAIACFVAQGEPMIDACAKAKEYTRGAIEHNPNLGKGFGPLNHCCLMWRA
ncbi:MAG: bifunctional hydroxymethylpyrimidine kinase/phosphomethylpyrimidine kinase [Clostridia bacterium]|nr:bifunctional hydroxymethylpyrimidine kinase/phosphomethylpyrimidine kinase [Clostridia bacterium]